MSEYKPGTVAVATVRGVEGVRVLWTGNENTGKWVAERAVTGDRFRLSSYWVDSHEITDIRPLVVLDLDDYSGERAVNYLRNLSRESRDVCGDSPSPRGKLALFIADQIEAQTRPPRIPEPGLWGVVEARVNYTPSTTRYYINAPNGWREATGDRYVQWGQLIDPTLIREGLS